MRQDNLITSIAAAAVLALGGAPCPVRGGEAIPEEILACPVEIRLSSGDVGLGFYLAIEYYVCLVTSYDNLFGRGTDQLLADSATLVSYSSNPRDTVSNQVDLVLGKGMTKAIAEVDYAAVRLFYLHGEPDSTDLRTTDIVTRVELGGRSLAVVRGDDIEQFDSVRVGSPVLVFDVPSVFESHWFRVSRPLVRRGAVAAKNEDSRRILIDCPLFDGSSGSPVFALVQDSAGGERYKLIGIAVESVAGSIADELSGTSTYTVVMPIYWLFNMELLW